MAKTATINARIEPKLKKELPFEVKLPNAATRRAIEAARRGNVRRFHSASELAKELERS